MQVVANPILPGSPDDPLWPAFGAIFASAPDAEQIDNRQMLQCLRHNAVVCGNNKQREATLRQLFVEAGCSDQNISEQQVKGSKLPNVICILPGSSDKVIIVGAHFDRVSEGDGVVDNWSSASLLPSFYEGLKNGPHKHTYIFVGFTDEEQGEVGSRFYARQMTKDQVAATSVITNRRRAD